MISLTWFRSMTVCDFIIKNPLFKAWKLILHLEISVSPNSGSINGGTQITITGNSFDMHETDHPTEILVGGIPCRIIPGTLTKTSVKCTTPAKPQTEAPFYTGMNNRLTMQKVY